MFYVNKSILIAFCQADAERNVLVYFDLEATDATNDIHNLSDNMYWSW